MHGISIIYREKNQNAKIRTVLISHRLLWPSYLSVSNVEILKFIQQFNTTIHINEAISLVLERALLDLSRMTSHNNKT